MRGLLSTIGALAALLMLMASAGMNFVFCDGYCGLRSELAAAVEGDRLRRTADELKNESTRLLRVVQVRTLIRKCRCFRACWDVMKASCAMP